MPAAVAIRGAPSPAPSAESLLGQCKESRDRAARSIADDDLVRRFRRTQEPAQRPAFPTVLATAVIRL